MTIVVYRGISNTGRMVRQITTAITESTATKVSLSLQVDGCDCIVFDVSCGDYYSSRV